MVFGEDHIPDPVPPVLDRSVSADDLGEVVGADLTSSEVGDRVDDLALPVDGVAAPSAAHDPRG
ncbi:MAG: hypothetical protein ACJ8H8_13790 [Geminicoccaceae bacterium]